MQIFTSAQKNRRSPPVFCVLAGDARKADALYILGDLFEARIGDDDPNPLYHEMAAAIKSLADSGVPCFLFTATVIFCSVNVLPVRAA